MVEVMHADADTNKSGGIVCIRFFFIMVVDLLILMMSVLLWMGSGVAVEAYP